MNDFFWDMSHVVIYALLLVNVVTAILRLCFDFFFAKQKMGFDNFRVQKIALESKSQEEMR